ncbi:MAG TPA: LytR C-terminal domain-containing protein [Acidimicrobiales bacterium]
MIIGLFLLRNWDGSSAGGTELATADADAGGDPAAPAGEGGAGGEAAEPSATTVAPRPPAEVTVRVLNATNVGGAAGNLSEQLVAGGYKTVDPDDAGQMLDVTKILFAGGYDREAVELARAIGSPADSLEPLTDPPQFDPAGAQLVVLLGADLAA